MEEKTMSFEERGRGTDDARPSAETIDFNDQKERKSAILAVPRF